MSMRIGGFTLEFLELFKEKDGESKGIDAKDSKALFDFNKEEAASMNVDDLLNMNVKDGKLVDTQNKNGGSEQELTKIINEYLDEESVIKALDSDKSGNLSKQELNKFFNTIKGNDKNLEDVSLSDVYEAAKQIENNEFELSEEEAAEDTEDATTETEETAGSESANEAGNTSNSGNAGGTNGGSTGGGLNNANGISNTGLTLDAEGNYKNMTEEELNAELTDAEAGIQKGQQDLSAVLNGTNTEVAAAKENEDAAYENYQNELKTLNEDMAKELDEIKTAADEKEQQVNTKKSEVSSQESKVSECQTNYDNAVSTRQSLESTLASLQSAASSADEEEQAAIQAQIAAVQAQVEAAKQKENQAKTQLDEAKTKLEQLKQEQSTLEQEKTTLDQQETAKNQEIAAKYPEIQTLQQSYTDAQSKYDSVKATEEKNANELIKHNESIKNNVQTELTARENKEKHKENTSSIKGMYDEEEGLSLVETAKKMLAKYGSTTGWCATGVSRTMSMHYDIQMGGHGFQWDSNMDQLVDKGMFREVTSDYATSDELSSLPAGAVVCWEATGGSSGGAKYGHVTIADGNGGEISDHHQKSIYKSVGGRSDQYRVYVPV